MPHFLINSNCETDNEITVTSSEQLHHLITVRRVKIGEIIKFANENKVGFECKIREISKKKLVAEILGKYPVTRELSADITVGICVIKPDAMFSSLQKSVETGAKTIVPLISDNCTVKESVVKNKIDKYRKIAAESVQQCERADVPEVADVMSIDEILSRSEFEKIIVFSERENFLTVRKYFEKNPYKGGKILILLGPEGGFSKREFSLFEEENIAEVTLGKLILRADTALAAAMALVSAETEDSCDD